MRINSDGNQESLFYVQAHVKASSARTHIGSADLPMHIIAYDMLFLILRVRLLSIARLSGLFLNRLSNIG
jgi:hypothetical protein